MRIYNIIRDFSGPDPLSMSITYDTFYALISSTLSIIPLCACFISYVVPASHGV